jgi:hypothetical protein
MQLNYEKLGLPRGATVLESLYLAAPSAMVLRVRDKDTKRDQLYWRRVKGKERYKPLVAAEPLRTIRSIASDPSGSTLYFLRFVCTPALDGHGDGLDFEALYQTEVRQGAHAKELVSAASLRGASLAAILGVAGNPPALYCSVRRQNRNRKAPRYSLERLDLATRKFSEICSLPGVFL